MAPDELTIAVATELLEKASQGDRALGAEPESGLPIFVKVGRNGAYLQVGEAQGEGTERPRTASIWPTVPVESITLERPSNSCSTPGCWVRIRPQVTRSPCRMDRTAPMSGPEKKTGACPELEMRDIRLYLRSTLTRPSHC